MDIGWRRRGALACVILITALTLLPVFDNGFVYDDLDVIQHGEVIHDAANVLEVFWRPAMYVSAEDPGPRAFDTYRPMTLVSFFWDSAISGRQPLAYHLTNLVAHLVCVALTFLVIESLIGRQSWLFALLGATWFALSPHPNTAQIWINGRSDLFCTAFGLAAVVIWRASQLTEARPARIGRSIAVGLLFLAGLLSKETLLMVVPAVVLWPETSPAPGLRERLIRSRPFLAASLAYVALRVGVLGGLRASGGGDHIATALRYLAAVELEGLAGALWPRRLYLRFLSEEFGALGPWEHTLLTVVLVAAASLLWMMRRQAPVVSWGLLWFGLCLAPTALIAGMLWPGFGRYLYLPCVGLAAAIASLSRMAWERFPRLRRAQAVAALAYLVFLGVSLRGWAKDFRDVESLYGAAIAQNPKGPHAYGWLGMAYRKLGREEESIGPLAIAHRLAPEEPRYTHHLLYALVETGRQEAAIQLAKDCVRQHESDAQECHLLLYSTYQMTDPEVAIGHLVDCVTRDRKRVRCDDALSHALTEHPLRAHFRQLVNALGHDPRR